MAIAPFTLRVRPERPTAIRPLLPAQAEPAQVLHHGRDELLAGPLWIEVFIAQDQSPSSGQRPFLRRPKSAGMAQMKKARWRRRQSASIARSHSKRPNLKDAISTLPNVSDRAEDPSLRRSEFHRVLSGKKGHTGNALSGTASFLETFVSTLQDEPQYAR